MGENTTRTVLVTGASRGIGFAIAERLVAQGHAVAGLSRSGGSPDGVLDITCDVTDTDAIDQAFSRIEDEIGPVEVLIANAGITDDTLLLRMTDEQFGRVLDTNLTSGFRLARRAARPMVRGRWGRMIFISSVVGSIGSAGQVNYAAAKSGLLGMARSLTRELGSRNITANVVAPGFIETDMTDALPEAKVAEYKAQIPAGRLGAVDDVAAVVEFLASDAAAYVSGALVPVDGGLGMGH